MRKIELKDVLDLTAYEKKRPEIRSRLIKHKNERRIHVGPKATYLFETHDTMWYQVQEMTRAERIVSEEGITGELNAYNELVPEKNQLSASMLIEISDEKERKSFLSKIVDLPDHTYLLVDNAKIRPKFDPRQGSEDKLSSVQYVKFTLTPDQADKFNQEGVKIIFGFDHEEYTCEYTLSGNEKITLFRDMQTD
jgi:hypothetical protein